MLIRVSLIIYKLSIITCSVCSAGIIVLASSSSTVRCGCFPWCVAITVTRVSSSTGDNLKEQQTNNKFPPLVLTGWAVHWELVNELLLLFSTLYAPADICISWCCLFRDIPIYENDIFLSNNDNAHIQFGTTDVIDCCNLVGSFLSTYKSISGKL